MFERKSVVPNADPLVKEFFRIARTSPLKTLFVADLSGVSVSTMKAWDIKQPRLQLFNAALQALGYELKIVRKANEARDN